MALLKSLLKLLGGTRAPDAKLPEPGSARRRPSDAAPAAPAVRTAPATVRTHLRVAPQPAPARDGPSPLDGDVDRRFTALLLGVGVLRTAEAEPAERRVIGQIEEMVGGGGDPSLVPRLPFVLPRLMSLLRRDDVAPRELAEQLSPDPTLVGEVVRMANSPRYRSGRDVADLHEAVMLLGQRGLSQIVINAAMRPIFSARQGRFSQIAGTTVWDVTERCSSACACLGGDEVDRFQAYLAGMATNIGLIVVLRLLDNGYRERQPPDTVAFHDALHRVSARLSGRIARQWNFPPMVCQAVLRQAEARGGPADDELTRLLRAADRISKWHVLEPGRVGDGLAGLDEPERLCYSELERAFGR